jgi:Flp pilus assembly protein TadD
MFSKKIRLLAVIISMIGMVTGSFVQAQEIACDPAVHYLFQGNDAYAAGDYAGAIAAYTCATQNERDEAAAYNSRGNTYRELGDFATALADYNRALEIDEDNAVIINNRGWAQYKLGDLKLALADFDLALTIDPNNAYAHNNRGIIFAEMGRKDEALSEFDSAISLGTLPGTWATSNRAYLSGYELSQPIVTEATGAMALVNEGWTAFNENDFDGAILLFTQAAQANPNSYYAFYSRGTTYAYTYQYELARADFDRAIELNTGRDFSVYINRGILNLITQEYEAAIVDFNRAIEVGPEPFCNCLTSPYSARGYAHYRLGEFDEAFADYATTLESRPEDPPTLVLRSILYNEQGDTDAARVDYQRWKDVVQLSLQAVEWAEAPLDLNLQQGVVYHIPVRLEAGQDLSVEVNLKEMSDLGVSIFLLDENELPIYPSDDSTAANAGSIEGFTAETNSTYTVVVTEIGNMSEKGDVEVTITVADAS